jgi:hypothetical protein
MQIGPTGSERRCPDCGALAAPDAEWCGQCLRSLAEPEPEPEPEPATGPVVVTTSAQITEPGRSAAPADPPSGRDGAPPAPTWPCPACGNTNALELDACAVCGTTFASLMRQDEAPPRVHPKDALSASLLFPGLGHRKVGRGLDGLARGVLFVVLTAMAATVFVSGVGSASTFGVFALFLGAALLVYFGSAWEAYHMADGGRAIVSSRALLWATVAVILASVMMLALSVVTFSNR